jgi:formylmethanofuran dehydrogenase subunit A
MTLTARMSLKTTFNSYTKEKTVFVPLEIQEEDKIACLNLLPIKSKDVYEKELQNSNAWKQERGVSGINEDVIRIGIFPQPPEKMCQLVDVDEVFMLKTTLKVHNNLDISKYGKLKALSEKSI